MKRLTAVVTIATVCASVAAKAQQTGTVPTAPGTRSAAVIASRQSRLDSPLHQAALSAGGKLVQERNANFSALSQNLPSLMERSEEVVLAHVLTSSGGISTAGDSVQSHYDVQILRSWKGQRLAGDVVTVYVPAGGLPFADRTSVETRVRGFSALVNGGRYVLFLQAFSAGDPGTASFQLVGDGVQGAFRLSEEKVQPLYQQGPLWRAYSHQTVSAFLAQLNASGERR